MCEEAFDEVINSETWASPQSEKIAEICVGLRAELARVTAGRDELRRLTRNGRRCDECMESKIAVDDLAKVMAERDAARAEVERLRAENKEMAAKITHAPVGDAQTYIHHADTSEEFAELRRIKSAAEEWRDQPVQCIRDERDKTVARDILAGRGPTP